MAKHTQRIRQQLPTNCLSVFDHFVGLALKSSSKIIHDNFKSDYSLNVLFTQGPMVSFRCSRKLSMYLVTGAKLYPLKRSVGLSKCNKTCCQMCTTNVNETDIFTGTFARKTCKIKSGSYSEQF